MSLFEKKKSAPPKETNGTIQTTIKKDAAQSIAARIRESQKKRQEQAVNKSSPLVFTATTEFVKGIQLQAVDEILNSKKGSKRKIEQVDESESSINNDREEHEKMLRENKFPPPPPPPPSSISNPPNKKQKREIPETSNKEKDMNKEDKEQPITKEKEPENKEKDLEKELEGIVEEPLVSSSLGATLQLLKRKGLPEEQVESFIGRKTDKREDNEYFLKKGLGKTSGDSIRLEHVDEYGRRLTPKEAFRILSHRFHGIVPGKNKREKRMRQLEQERKRASMGSTDTPLGTIEAIRKEMEKSQTPFIVLSGKSSSTSQSSVPLGKTLISKEGAKSKDSTTKLSESNNEDTAKTNNNSNNNNISNNSSSSTKPTGGFQPGQFREFKLNIGNKKK